MTDEQQQQQQQQQQPEDLDFIICLSFHKLQEQNHSLLPFVLIRNALTSQPQPSSPLIWTKEAEDSEMKEEQVEQQNWLDACFDDLEQEDSLMDDFGDMMLCASAERAGIDPRQMPPFFFPLHHHDKQDDGDSPQQQQTAYQHGDTRENDTNHMS
ncbi:hypothetical protein BJV82DRAFT_103292 [Fennellomyces sp. T-0311]|nr:hypothetical protein BJV82DRAFT_103292 [Fennellomyces sp. T-0311]